MNVSDDLQWIMKQLLLGFLENANERVKNKNSVNLKEEGFTFGVWDCLKYHLADFAILLCRDYLKLIAATRK